MASVKPSSGGVVAPATARPSGPPARPRRASTDRHGSGSAAFVPGRGRPEKRPPITARTSPMAGSSASSAPAATSASMDVSIASGESNSATLASLAHR